MLVGVKFKNFKSFSSETFIDLRPSKIEYLQDINVKNNVLKGCAFYGSNACGKTNALNAITLLLDLLFKTFSVPIEAFTKFNDEKKMYFKYDFLIDSNTIVYSFKIDKFKGITEEKLFINGDIKLDRQIGSAKSFITENEDYDEVDRYTLFLRNIYFNTRFVGQPILIKWITYLKNSIYYNPFRVVNKFVSFDQHQTKNLYLEPYLEANGEKDINDFLTCFNFPFTIAYRKKDNLNSEPIELRLSVNRKGFPPIPLYMESVGNQILLSFLPCYLTVIKNGGILAIDEFSSGFHNDLEELLIKYFYEKCTNGQLFFVSHSTNILKTSIIRPDQVYAVDFNENGSIINKFSSYGMRESQNMEKMYLSGAFGGIPLYATKSE